jgi:hypothetical protein
MFKGLFGGKVAPEAPDAFSVLLAKQEAEVAARQATTEAMKTRLRAVSFAAEGATPAEAAAATRRATVAHSNLAAAEIAVRVAEFRRDSSLGATGKAVVAPAKLGPKVAMSRTTLAREFEEAKAAVEHAKLRVDILARGIAALKAGPSTPEATDKLIDLTGRHAVATLDFEQAQREFAVAAERQWLCT